MPAIEKKQTDSVKSVTLKKWGTSQGVRIPKQLCSWAGIGQDSELSMETGVDAQGRFILLRPVFADNHKHYGANVDAVSMDVLFAGYTGNYQPHEMDWGEDVGHEVVE